MIIFDGLKEILSGAKGTATLIFLATISFVSLRGHLDGAAFSACVATIAAIFMGTHSYDQTQNNNDKPEKGV